MKEIVVKIDDKLYNRIKYLEPKADTMLDELMRIIQSGISLPEHHGRLIDENDLKTLYELDDRLWWSNAIKEFTDLPTIIEGVTQNDK